MGESLLRLWRTRVKKEYRFAFFFSVLVIFLIHMYKFTNALPNHDAVLNYYTDQNILGSGRWALSLACGISSYYDLPWVIGLLSCLYIGLTVVVIVALLRVKNYVVIGLIAGILAASPATTETFFYMYTADGYMLAMLMAALAVYLSRIEEKRKSRWFLSGALLCVSCGIYQAYVAFALILTICYLIIGLLENRYDKKTCWLWILRQAVTYAAALCVYFVIWKLCMRITGTTVNPYQGINEVGNMNLAMIINGLRRTVNTIITFFFQWNVLEKGLSTYIVLNILFFVAFAVGLVGAVIKSKLYQRKWALVLMILCLIAMIPASCIWHFTSGYIAYRPRMLHSLVLLYILTALIYEKWLSTVLKNVLCGLLALIIVNHSMIANICYFHLNLCYERSYAEGMELASNIRQMQEEHGVERIAVVGYRFFEVYLYSSRPDIEDNTYLREIGLLSDELEETLMYDSYHVIPFLEWNFGIEIEEVSYQEKMDLFHSDQVQQMPCWPASDSITVIDDVLVIKLSNQE